MSINIMKKNNKHLYQIGNVFGENFSFVIDVVSFTHNFNGRICSDVVDFGKEEGFFIKKMDDKVYVVAKKGKQSIFFAINNITSLELKYNLHAFMYIQDEDGCVFLPFRKEIKALFSKLKHIPCIKELYTHFIALHKSLDKMNDCDISIVKKMIGDEMYNALSIRLINNELGYACYRNVIGSCYNKNRLLHIRDKFKIKCNKEVLPYFIDYLEDYLCRFGDYMLLPLKDFGYVMIRDVENMDKNVYFEVANGAVYANDLDDCVAHKTIMRTLMVKQKLTGKSLGEILQEIEL